MDEYFYAFCIYLLKLCTITFSNREVVYTFHFKVMDRRELPDSVRELSFSEKVTFDSSTVLSSHVGFKNKDINVKTSRHIHRFFQNTSSLDLLIQFVTIKSHGQSSNTLHRS